MTVGNSKMLHAQLKFIGKKIEECKSKLDKLLKDAEKCLDNFDYNGYKKVLGQIITLIDELEKCIKKLKALELISIKGPKITTPKKTIIPKDRNQL